MRKDKVGLGFSLLLILSAGLTACSSGSSWPLTPPAAPANLSASFAPKQIQFTWTANSGGVIYYRLEESPDGVAAFTQVGSNIPPAATSANASVTVYTQNWTAAQYALDACNNAGCARSNVVNPAAGMLSSIGYFKASNTAPNAFAGTSIALSSDGSTMAVGAFGESSGATGINGNQADHSAPDAGAVYVFTAVNGAWAQQAYLKASDTLANADFGHALALSADGNTLAVGAFSEASAATGVGGNQADTSAPGAGAVYVYSRTGINWAQQAYIKASNTVAGIAFGLSVGLSSDGSTLVAGAPFESSNATGIGGNQADHSAANAGAAYIFTRAASVWTQQAYIKASNTHANNEFGYSSNFSGDGNTLVVGSTGEPSIATGVGGNQSDTTAQNAGAAYIFTRNGSAWTQQAYLKASNTAAGSEFGYATRLSTDGTTLAVGAPNEGSSATGVGGNQTGNAAPSSGAIYVFARSGTTWSQQAYVKESNTGAGDFFGIAAAFSGNGSTLAVGAEGEASNATGVGGSQINNSDPNAGAVYIYTRTGTTWGETSYVKASNTAANASFGFSVALSNDGSTLAVGATNESSDATGINGNQTDHSATFAGAVYLY